MRISKIAIKNFRSIVEIKETQIQNFQALVGENNAGKSNILAAIDVFTSAGSGGVTESDFYDKAKPVEIKCYFSDLSAEENKVWKKYLKKGELELIKVLELVLDERTGKSKIETEFHGFESEPKLVHLSLAKLEEAKVKDWTALVTENGLPNYFLKDGKATKTTYQKGLEQYLQENDVEFDVSTQSESHALGLKSNVAARLPKIFILPAITSFKDETDTRRSNTIFNRLMAEITERILKVDPKYKKLEEAVAQLSSLFNGSNVLNTDANVTVESTRFSKLDEVEEVMTDLLKTLMPTVSKLKLIATIDGVENLLRQSLEVRVDDGLSSDVFSKGHGLQRCIIFSLLQALIKSTRGQLVSESKNTNNDSIILLIEEPELYIHAQLRGLFFDALETFSESDQVIFTTHSSDFIDISNFFNIAVVKKDSLLTGTKIHSPDFSITLSDKEKFKKLTKVNPYLNEILFSKKVLLVEGPEDKTALVQGLMELNVIKKRVEEIGFSIVVASGKQSIPDIVRVLNAFSISYIVLHDTDIHSKNVNEHEMHKKDNDKISKLISVNGRLILLEPKLEMLLKRESHFKDQFEVVSFLSDPKNHTPEFQAVLNDMLKVT